MVMNPSSAGVVFALRISYTSSDMFEMINLVVGFWETKHMVHFDHQGK